MAEFNLNMQALGNAANAPEGARQHARSKAPFFQFYMPPALLNGIISRHNANCFPGTAKRVGGKSGAGPSLIGSRPAFAKKSRSGKEVDSEESRPIIIEEANTRFLDNLALRDQVVPMRTFRRIRPWAGDRIRKADINRYDLYQLPIFPSEERALAPWTDTRAPLGPSSNGVTAPPVAPNGSTTTPAPAPEGVRRNPRRTARKNLRY